MALDRSKDEALREQEAEARRKERKRKREEEKAVSITFLRQHALVCLFPGCTF